MHLNLIPPLALRRQSIAMQEAQIRQRRRKPRGAMPHRRRKIAGRGSGAVLAVERMSQPIRRTHGDGVRDVVGNNGWRVDPDHRVVAGGVGGPMDNVVRFGEAIELRQSQRAAVPLQCGEAARLAFPTGFNSEEAQGVFILLRTVSLTAAAQ
jgi:hypothetical protein